MPVVNVAGQVNQQSQAGTTQKNLGQMIGEVQQWNPNAPITMIRTWINQAQRSLVDRRFWYGLMTRGQVAVPSVYNTGTISLTNGNAIVTGVNTLWQTNGIQANYQLRAGFSTGFYNIKSVDSETQITLDLPWGHSNQVNVGYSIMKVWVSLGFNIKSVLEIANQRQGYRLYTGLPQAILNRYDVWRTNTGWTWGLFPKEATADGQPQFELYPAPTFQQAFPFLAYIQPPDMVADADFPAPFIRSDILILPAISNALIFRGPKENKYYDAATAAQKLREFEAKYQEMSMADDSLYPKDYRWDYSAWPYSKHGALWLQSHAGEFYEDI